MTGGGFIEYPAGFEQRIQSLKAELEQAHFYTHDAEAREAILAEIIAAYDLYYCATTHKPDALSDAKRQCDRMVNAAHKMLNSIESMNDPITPQYDYWMHRNNVHGSLEDALNNHVRALYWTELQLEKAAKPEQQSKTGARQQFVRTLRAIYKRHNPPSETADFNDNQGAFIADTLEVFDF